MVACVSRYSHPFLFYSWGERNPNWLNYKRMGETGDQVKFTVALFHRHKQQIAGVIVISRRVMQPSGVSLQPLSLERRVGLF